jgi:hypothetical protein
MRMTNEALSIFDRIDEGVATLSADQVEQVSANAALVIIPNSGLWTGGRHREGAFAPKAKLPLVRKFAVRLS